MKRGIVALTLLNVLLLIPGVTLPIYGVVIRSQVAAEIISEPVMVTVYEQSRSILGTVDELWNSGDQLVSFLILLFSIIVPLAKGSMLLLAVYTATDRIRQWLVWVVDLIGKWSMADVFVVAVFLAFLATRDQVQATSFSVSVAILPPIEVEMETHVTSTLGPGFYCFLGYCLFSVLWAQVIKHRHVD
ncbi:MAG: hypothetical protein CL484_14980 [Acidobacteria bacterium]|mgnify:CR=1 FL=1|nr:hypothetical protein [Acidobacteriota bacterium]